MYTVDHTQTLAKIIKRVRVNSRETSINVLIYRKQLYILLHHRCVYMYRRSLRAAFRRELLRAARGSLRSRKLRNELANLILAGITRNTAKWQLSNTGLIDDLAEFFVVSEHANVDGWAVGVIMEIDNITGLDFKKTLLTILARIAEWMPKCVEVRNRITENTKFLMKLSFNVL